MNATVAKSVPTRSARPRRQLARRAWGFIKCLLGPGRCREVDRLLYQLVENELDEPARQRLERHIADCPACLEYVKTYRRVVFLTGRSDLSCEKMPPALERKLEDFIDSNPQLR